MVQEKHADRIELEIGPEKEISGAAKKCFLKVVVIRIVSWRPR